MLLAALALGGCTDASLYGLVGREAKLADKLTVTGLLCTDNPASRRFPVKILFLVDTSGTTIDAAPLGEHVRAIESTVAQTLPNRNVEIGVIRYADRARSLLEAPVGPSLTGFTRDDARIDAALAELRNGGGGRDLAAAMSLARSVITGDAFLADRGPLSRTKYVIVHLTSGAPAPGIPAARCQEGFEVPPDDCERAFLARAVRDLRDEVLSIGAAELVFHVAHLEPAAIEGAPCDPRNGSVGCPGGLACVPAGSFPDVGRCVEPCDPQSPLCVLDPARTRCSVVPVATVGGPVDVAHCARPVETACFDGVDNDGDGRAIDCDDPSYPLDCDGSDGCEDDCLGQCRAAAIGLDMSLPTGGAYVRFPTADRLSFGRFDLRSTQRRFVLKTFVVENTNALPTEGGLSVDTDGDGLADEVERRLEGFDPTRRDTDDDGFSDALELRLRGTSLDPLGVDLPPTCQDPYEDGDADGLGDCEEALLGTDPSLFDSDADGFPDPMEVRRGTNPLEADVLDDLDQDGAPNGRELAENGDPRSSDVAARSELAYRYTIIPAGTTQDNRTCYDLRVSNITLVETEDRGFGPGNNALFVYFGQVPEGELDRFGTFSVAELRVRFVAPDFREPDAVALDLEDEDFVFLGE